MCIQQSLFCCVWMPRCRYWPLPFPPASWHLLKHGRMPRKPEWSWSMVTGLEAGPAGYWSLPWTESGLCAENMQWARSQHINTSCPVTHICSMWTLKPTLLLPYMCLAVIKRLDCRYFLLSYVKIHLIIFNVDLKEFLAPRTLVIMCIHAQNTCTLWHTYLPKCSPPAVWCLQLPPLSADIFYWTFSIFWLLEISLAIQGWCNSCTYTWEFFRSGTGNCILSCTCVGHIIHWSLMLAEDSVANRQNF